MQMRICERLINDTWEVIKFEDLKKGDIFRLWEPDDDGNRLATVACPICGSALLQADSDCILSPYTEPVHQVQASRSHSEFCSRKD